MRTDVIRLCTLLVLGPACLGGAVPTRAGEVPAAHATASCTPCHSGTSPAAGKVPNARCTACHSGRDAGPSPTAAGLGTACGRRHADDPRSCVGCHGFHDPSRVATAAGDLDLAGSRAVAPGHCLPCHGAGADPQALSPSHREAAAVYHGRSAELVGASVSRGCLNCHDSRSLSDWKTATAEPPLTFSVHASHPVGVAIRPGAGVAARRIRTDPDPRIPLFDGRIECQSCHDLTATTKNLVRPLGQPRDLCLGCHRIGPSRDAPDREPDVALGSP